jgi:hypothetical protein
MSQSTRNLLMIRPVNFAFNEQTADSNAFQARSADVQEVQAKAIAEFDGLVKLLKDNTINVKVIEDTPQPYTPDAVFPNNWVSFHEDGDVIIYPMKAENRRLERREDIIRKLEDNFIVRHIIDLGRFELQNKFLEGTGSMVLDRENKTAYACISPRTDADVLSTFCEHTGYRAVTFKGLDEKGLAIYHTNVMMCVGTDFAVICLDAISDNLEKEQVKESLENTGKQIIPISFTQMNRFAGNMLEILNNDGDKLIVMSQSAYDCLNDEQRKQLSSFGKLIYADISTIETNGGGSARCMLAEVHLPLSNNDQ